MIFELVANLLCFMRLCAKPIPAGVQKFTELGGLLAEVRNEAGLGIAADRMATDPFRTAFEEGNYSLLPFIIRYRSPDDSTEKDLSIS